MALSPGQIVGTLTRAGLTRAAAAGVAGNLMQESSDNPADAGGGLAQWQGSRYTGLTQYASSRGLAPTSGQAALGYLIQDLNGAYKGLKGQLNSARTPGEAAQLFSNIYERPGTPMMGNRIRYAQQAFGAGGGALPLGPGAPATGAGVNALKQMSGRTVSKTTQGFDQAGYQAAQANAIAGQYLNTQAKDPYSIGAPKTGLTTSPGANPLLSSGALATKAPNPADYMTSQTTLEKIAGTPLAKHPAGSDPAVANQAVSDAAAAGAPKAAQKLLRMVNFVVGAKYNQGNRDLNENEFQIKAGGTDCSGLISWLMGPQGLGIWHTTLATPAIASAPGLQAGKGQFITIYNNKQAGNAGHVFIGIRTGNTTQYFASEGGGVGIHQLPISEVQNYLQHGSDGGTYQALHPKGL